MSLQKHIYNEYMSLILLKLEDKLCYYENTIHSFICADKLLEADYYVEERDKLKDAIDKIKYYSGKWHF